MVGSRILFADAGRCRPGGGAVCRACVLQLHCGDFVQGGGADVMAEDVNYCLLERKKGECHPRARPADRANRRETLTKSMRDDFISHKVGTPLDQSLPKKDKKSKIANSTSIRYLRLAGAK